MICRRQALPETVTGSSYGPRARLEVLPHFQHEKPSRKGNRESETGSQSPVTRVEEGRSWKHGGPITPLLSHSNWRRDESLHAIAVVASSASGRELLNHTELLDRSNR